MDSGNSGSMQSSSGGDEEYDSRAESISALFNSTDQISPPGPSHNLPLFDAMSNYLDPFSRSQPPPPHMNSFLNLDPAWARGLRSDPNCTDMGGLMVSSSSTPPPIYAPNRTTPYISQSMPLSSGFENDGRPKASTDPPNVIRNSKKRSRASRRAPTTVLTTDTTNFRAMVQEFTGIPAQPFSASSFPRTRFDLFSPGSSMRTGISDPPLSPYLLRPFVQKVQPRPSFAPFPFNSFSSSSSSSSSSSMIFDVARSKATDNSISIGTIGTCNNSTGAIASDPLNMQNQFFSFQSVLQSSHSPPKYPSTNLSAFSDKEHEQITMGSTDSHLKIGTLEDLSMNHGHGNRHHGDTLANMITSAGMSSSRNDHLRSSDGNYSNSQQVSRCKMNYTASSSDFNAEKGSENVSSRGEGMVDSWICSSD